MVLHLSFPLLGMETTLKTAEFELVAANYDDMFAKIIKLVPQEQKWVKDEINWAKTILKKQDRITWWLRYYRLALLKALVEGRGNLKSDPDLQANLEAIKKMYDAEYRSISSRAGITFPVPNVGQLDRLRNELDHFLALPVPAIQNLVWDRQAPPDLVEEFKEHEDKWKAESAEQKRGLPIHEGDSIAVQFQDGWAWWLLGRGYCSEEAKAMGHCGNVAGKYNSDERILSLRKPVGNDQWAPSLTFILDGEGYLGEMKGRGNEKPSEKYHPYIVALLERTDLVKGVKGGGYLPTHNFALNDLDIETQDRLSKINPALQSARRQFNQLQKEKKIGWQFPEFQQFVNRVEKAAQIDVRDGTFDDKLKGWIDEEWDNPGAFIDDQLRHTSFGRVWKELDSEYEPSRGYDTNQIAREVIDKLDRQSIDIIFDSLEAQPKIAEWLKKEAEGSKYRNQYNVMQPRSRELLLGFLNTNDPNVANFSAYYLQKLINVWKAGFTDTVRNHMKEALQKGLQEDLYHRGPKGIIFTGKGDAFWTSPVKTFYPLYTAIDKADGSGDWEENQGGEYEDYGDTWEDNWRYQDPVKEEYQKLLKNELKPIVDKMDEDEKQRVSEMENNFFRGQTAQFMDWVDSVVPGAWDQVKDISWDLDAAKTRLMQEFQQLDLPFGKAKSQHASLLLQKNATFEIIAANYDEMFNVITKYPADEENVKNVIALTTGNYKDEIAWAKQHLKKQDRIVWWLRWYRLALLTELTHNLQTNLKDATAYDQLYTEVGGKKPVSPEKQERINKVTAAWEYFNKQAQSELRSLRTRTNDQGLEPPTQNFFQRSHHKVDHFLSLPVAKIQNMVWDKQSHLTLFQEMEVYEKQWQDETKGLLKPHDNPEKDWERDTDTIERTQYHLTEMESELDSLQIKLKNKPKGWKNTSDSVWPYHVQTVTPEQAQQRIQTLQAEIQKTRDQLNQLNTPEVDTVFLQFQDGWAWWKLSRAYCSEEAKAMGHCGNVTGQSKTDQRILSLRKPVQRGKDKYWEPHLTFILEPNGKLGEMKGRANQKPAPQYHPYIIALLEDPRIKGVKGGGYAPERNFAMADLPKETQEAIIKKNPNLMALSARYQRLMQGTQTPGQPNMFPASAQQWAQLKKDIEEILWPEDSDYSEELPDFKEEYNGWVVDYWKSIDELVQERGNETAKWVGEQIGEGGGDFDYYEGLDLNQLISDLNSKQEAMVRHFIEVEYPDEVQAWKEQQIDDGDEDPDFNDADLADFINEQGLDEVEQGIMRAGATAAQYGAEAEMYTALTSAVEEYTVQDTGEEIILKKYKNPETGKESLTWDSPVVGVLRLPQAAALADKGEPWGYWKGEDDQGEITVEQPYYGWSGWDDDAFNDALQEEFSGPQSAEEKAQQEAKQQKSLEALAKKYPQAGVKRDSNGKIVGWTESPFNPDNTKKWDAEAKAKKKKKKPKTRSTHASTKVAYEPSEFNAKKNELLEKLKALPYADKIKVFGGMATGHEDRDPADIDLVVDLRGETKHNAWTDLLALAKEYYGYLDPFIISDAGVMDGKPYFELWARNDNATGWIRSRNKNKMLKNMSEQGKPLSLIKPLELKKAAQNFTPQQMEREAEIWQDQFPADSPGGGPASKYVWHQDNAFPVAKLEGDASFWKPWFDQEKQWAAEDGREGYYENQEKWWTTNPDEHMIVVQGTDGQFYVWEGTHRLAISKINNMEKVPAFVGVPKDGKTSAKKKKKKPGIQIDKSLKGKAPFVPVVLTIEVPTEAREHFWNDPPAGNLEFWAFSDRPKAFINEKIIFTFDKKPMAEARILKIEEPGQSKCEETGRYEKFHKVFWSPQEFKKLGGKTADVNQLEEVNKLVKPEFDAVRYVVGYMQQNNIQQMPWKQFQQTFQQFAAKYNALFTQIRKNKPQVTLADLQEWLQEQQYAQPEDQEFGVEYDRYHEPETSFRDVEQMVLRVNQGANAQRILGEDNALAQYVGFVSQSSVQSGHPAGMDTVGWLRVDAVNQDWLLVDEVQSDLVNSVSQAKLIVQANNFEEFMASLANDHMRNLVHEKGIGPGNFSVAKRNFVGQGYTLEKLEAIKEKLIELSKNWAEYAIATVLEIARRSGIKNVAIHTAETIGQRDPGVESNKIKIFYDNLAKSFGFKKQQLDMGELSGNFWVRTASDKSYKKAAKGYKIDAHQLGNTIWIDWYEIPANDRGKGLGRKYYEAWESKLPKSIKLLRLFAGNTETGQAEEFWAKMGFEPVFNDEEGQYSYYMWKGINGNATPPSQPSPDSDPGYDVMDEPEKQASVKTANDTVTLSDLYEGGELDDENEGIGRYISQFGNMYRDQIIYRPFTVRMLPADQVKQLKVNDSQTVEEVFKDHAESWQKKLVKQKMKKFDKNRVIVLQGGRILDGNHHVVAAIQLGQPVEYIDVNEPELPKKASKAFEQKLYRGQREMQAGRGYASDPGDFGRGIYWTSDIHRARAYGKVVEQVVKLNNPLYLTVEQAYDLGEQEYGDLLHGENRMEKAENMTRDLLSKGYDGLVAKDKDGHLEVVDYRPYATKLAAARQIYYHGTDIKNLRSILTEGLVPEGKSKSWADDPDASMGAPSRQSYGGVYLSKNMMTALGAPRHGKSNPDFRMVMVCVEAQPNALYLDEDSIVSILDAPFENGSQNDSEFLVGEYFMMTLPNAPESMKEAFQQSQARYVERVIENIRYRLSEAKLTLAPELEKRLRELLPGMFLASLTRRAAHAFKSDQRRIEKDGYDARNYDYQRVYRRIMGDHAEIPAKHSIIPPPQEAEAKFRETAEQFTRTLRSMIRIGQQDAWQFQNARVTEPIGYSGSNRIIAVLELREGRGLQIEYNDPDGYEGKGRMTPIVVHYGKPPADFEKQWDERVGNKIYWMKPGQEQPPSTYVKPEPKQEELAPATASKTAEDKFNEEGLWAGEGNAASGILPVCKSTGRVGLAVRSKEVDFPGTISTIGGAVKQGMSPSESAKAELKEETGFSGGVQLIPGYVFTSEGGFKYHNFIGVVENEFNLKPSSHAFETVSLDWVPYEEMLADMKKHSSHYHPGFVKLIHNSDDVIRKALGTKNAAAKDPKLTAFMEDLWQQTYGNPFNNRERVWQDKAIIEAYPFDGKIHLSFIRSVEQGKGWGTEGLKFLLGLAQKHGVKVDLGAKPVGKGGLNKNQLVDWYGRHGFNQVPGEDRGSMEWEPEEVLQLDGKMKTIPIKGSTKTAGINGDTAMWKTPEKPFVVGAVNLLDGMIEEVHNYEQMSAADWHHSFVFSSHVQMMEREGEVGIFWVENNGEVASHEPIPPHIKAQIKQQIEPLHPSPMFPVKGQSAKEAAGEKEMPPKIAAFVNRWSKYARPTQEKINLLKQRYKFDDQVIEQIIQTDPTEKDYVQWLGAQVAKKTIRLPEDTAKIKQQLETFTKLKRSPQFQSSKDIQNYTPASLYQMLQQNAQQPESYSKKEQERQTVEKGAEIILENGDYRIYEVPMVPPGDSDDTPIQALCSLSGGTNWCTAQSHYGESYLEDGPSYVMFYKGSAYAQLHPNSDQFMDRTDDSLVDTIISHEGEGREARRIGIEVITDPIAQDFINLLAPIREDVKEWASGLKNPQEFNPNSNQVRMDIDQRIKLAIARGERLDKQWENTFLNKPNNLYVKSELVNTYIARSVKQRVPQWEAAILNYWGSDISTERLVELDLDYIQKVLKARWPEFEKNYGELKNAYHPWQVAEKYCIPFKVRMPNVEEGLLHYAGARQTNTRANQKGAVEYAAALIPERSHFHDRLEAELLEVLTPEAVDYAANVLKQRWPELEIELLRGGDHRYQPMDLQARPLYAQCVDYAIRVVDGRWPEFEQKLIGVPSKNPWVFPVSFPDPQILREYVIGAVRDRWPEFEKMMIDVLTELKDATHDYQLVFDAYLNALEELGLDWPEGVDAFKKVTGKLPR